MSVDLYDLAQRIAAARRGAPVARMRYAPALPPTEPVAVTVTGPDNAPLITVTTDKGTWTSAHGDPLRALSLAGVDTGRRRTLVVEDLRTLARLHELARAEPDDRHGHTAAVIEWWVNRAEHPGTTAVVIVVDACAQRWITGCTPDEEKSIETWRAWLGITDTGTQALLSLAVRVTAGEPLPRLKSFDESDAYSWTALLDVLAKGYSWRARDNRLRAALGLQTRCDAADLYPSLLLADPSVAERQSFAGNVVTGTVSKQDSKSLTIRTDRLICRLRPGQKVEGWDGGPGDVITGTTPGRTHLVAVVESSGIDPVTGQLVLILESTIIRVSRNPNEKTKRETISLVGQRITLRAAQVDALQQQRGRRNMATRYKKPSWLTGRGTPTIRRRPVPMDVVFAAADE